MYLTCCPSVWRDRSACGSSLWQRGRGGLSVQHPCQSRPGRQGRNLKIYSHIHRKIKRYNYVIFLFWFLNFQEQETPLHCAAWHGYSTVARALCQAGCRVNAKNREGESPLLTASARGFVDIVECLVEHQANLEASDKVNIYQCCF